MYGGPLATRSISVLTDSEAPRQRMGAVESCMNPRSPTDLCASNDVHSPSQDQVKSVRQSWEDSGREMEGGSGAHGPPRKQVKSVTQYPSWDDSTPWEMQGRSPTRRGGVVLVRGTSAEKSPGGAGAALGKMPAQSEWSEPSEGAANQVPPSPRGAVHRIVEEQPGKNGYKAVDVSGLRTSPDSYRAARISARGRAVEEGSRQRAGGEESHRGRTSTEVTMVSNREYIDPALRHRKTLSKERDELMELYEAARNDGFVRAGTTEWYQPPERDVAGGAGTAKPAGGESRLAHDHSKYSQEEVGMKFLGVL
ncbi:hypothetical protein T484DRAFT_1956438 [Baffinella frigidus]|nr:hypothetical protein T484DRAFT_1956438 [Cryptophyta sp. CCMP2293]